jgi:hypothetical protein
MRYWDGWNIQPGPSPDTVCPKSPILLIHNNNVMNDRLVLFVTTMHLGYVLLTKQFYLLRFNTVTPDVHLDFFTATGNTALHH